MKQIDGQINFTEYIKSQKTVFRHCGQCACRNCLLWQSKRCPYKGCYDDYRAKKEPYNKAHPDEPKRKSWSNWDKPGEQEHWCRGGISYPVSYCEYFIKYKGCTIEECVRCKIGVFQDGYIDCTYKDSVGCEVCVEQQAVEERIKRYGCQHMTETGCEAHINALALMAENILKEGEDMEMCGKQCCIGCTKSCGYRCGRT